MEPLSATVAAIVTSFATKGIQTLSGEVGAAASRAAQTLAQAVLDRLRQDPLEQRTVERYERDPEGQQGSIEQAVADLVKADVQFGARLQELVETYQTAAGNSGISVAGDVQGNVVQGGDNVVVRDNTGTIRVGRDPD